MRHKKKGRKLGRTASHRKATLKSLAQAIIEHKEIKTTLAKAKEAKRHIERLITYTKDDTVHARRLAYKVLNNHQSVKVLFDEIGPVFDERNGGYSRVIQLGQRKGDAAEMAILQLVGFEKMDEIELATKKAAQPKAKAEKEETTEKVETAKEEDKKELKAEETEAETEADVETEAVEKKEKKEDKEEKSE